MEGNGGEEREREREMMIVCCLFDSVLYQKQLELRSTYLKVCTNREREREKREREIERERERGKEEGRGREKERGGVKRVCQWRGVGLCSGALDLRSCYAAPGLVRPDKLPLGKD